VQRWASRTAVAVFVAAIFFSVFFSGRHCAWCAEPAEVQEAIAAGEFPAALALAEAARNAPERDRIFRNVALAQARAGARDAWSATVSLMADDRSRASTLDDIASQPLLGAGGGGQEADFESLIELITSTVASTTWDESGGPGSIKEFESGVHVDPDGFVRHGLRKASAPDLIGLRRLAAAAGGEQQIGRTSVLRKISLTRLEKAVQLRLAQGREPTDEMRYLAGLERVTHVLVYPEQRELVLAGPAGTWTTSAEGRIVSAKTGRPVVHLNDLVTILRHVAGSPDGGFGCSIVPRPEALARTKALVEASSRAPLKPGQRGKWLESVRRSVGRQDVRIRGIDPTTRVARVIVEADYRMKLVGMGLENGTLGVQSYLQLVSAPRGQAPPPLEVLRWWFTLDYEALRATPAHDAFEIRGPGVKVLSENELLTKLGKRVHTGASEPLNKRFAESFNEHFPALAVKYPIYAELQNVCDLALVCALIKAEGLADRTDWHWISFGPGGSYPVAHGQAPSTVETVANHRVLGGKHIVAGVSGGVSVDPAKFISPAAVKVDTYGVLRATRAESAPEKLPPLTWWWD